MLFSLELLEVLRGNVRTLVEVRGNDVTDLDVDARGVARLDERLERLGGDVFVQTGLAFVPAFAQVSAVALGFLREGKRGTRSSKTVKLFGSVTD